MYYVAFFLDYRPLVGESLGVFLNNDFSDVWLNQRGQQHSRLLSIEQIPLLEDAYPPRHCYPQPWYVHGSSYCTNVTDKWPDLPLLNGTSLKRVDILFDWFANSFSWAFFPWGGRGFCFSFAFVSRNNNLRDRFIDTVSHVVNTQSISAAMPNTNYLVSSYDIKTNVSSYVQALVFVIKKPGERLLTVYNCDDNLPWLVTDRYYNNPEFELTDDENNDVREVKFLEFLTNETNLPLELRRRRVGVIQPVSRAVFGTMSETFLSSEAETLIAVPQSTNLEKLQKILEKTEANSFINCDLKYLENIFCATEWFYGIGRDFGDDRYSIFITKNNALINKFEKFEADDEFCLISYF